MDCKNEFIKESEKLDKFFDEIQIICEKYGYSISHEDGHGNFFLEDYDDFYMNWFRDASIRVNNKKYDQFYDKWRKYQLEYNKIKLRDMSKILKQIELKKEDILTIHGVVAMLPTDKECDKLAENGANMYVPDKWADGYKQGYLNALMQIKKELTLLAKGN